MLTATDMTAWAEIQDGLDRAAEREFEARVMWEHYERRRREIAKQIEGGRYGQSIAVAERWELNPSAQHAWVDRDSDAG